MYKDKILLCGIGRQENNYIREWIDHYKNIGVDHIVIYDNNYDGEDRFEDVIQDYIDDDYVTVVDFRNKEVCQLKAYQNCYDTYTDYTWIMFFDMDEFLCISEDIDIHEFLGSEKFDLFDGIRFCWLNYNDNGLVCVENDNYSCKERFHDFRKHTHCKSIFRTNNKNVDFLKSHNADAHGCYNPILKMCDCNGKVCKNENFDIGDTCICDTAWLNHYRYKTIDEFIRFKLNRCYPDAKKEYTISKGFGINTFFYTNQKTDEKIEYARKLGIKI